MIAHRTSLVFLAFMALLGFCYWPGVTGDFLFDDAFNLKNLGAFGVVDDWQTFLLYITSGNADPTGRPVSMLSFLWDANNWPADAEHFKKTNILIHILNAALLYRVLLLVESKLGMDLKTSMCTAALAATIWAAHPFFVSTVLYVVQRHAMLPLTFTLLAWLAWSKVEHEAVIGNRKRAWAWGILGVWGLTLLAGLSKANGFLAPLLILASFSILNNAQPKCAGIKCMSFVLLAIPAAIMGIYLLLQLRHGLDSNFGRDFTLSERLLTQPRVLFIYLSELYLPGTINRGFYFGDTIQASKDLLNPISTLISLVAFVLMVLISWFFRKSSPRIALAIQWFIIAHLVESSTIMLELYFEHRNYLPSVFLFLPVSSWLISGKSLHAIRMLLIICISSLLLFITYNKSVMWGNPAIQAQMWEESNKDSYRNIMNSVTNAKSRDELDRSISNINTLISKNPRAINLYLGLIGAECQTYGSNEQVWRMTYLAAEHDNEFNVGTIDWLSHAIRISQKNTCPNLDAEKVRLLLDAFSRNESIIEKGSTKSILYHLKGYLEALGGNYPVALENYNKAVELNPDPNFVLTQAALLGNIGQEKYALRHIEFYKSITKMPRVNYPGMQMIHGWLLEHYGFYHNELMQLESSLRKNGDLIHTMASD